MNTRKILCHDCLYEVSVVWVWCCMCVVEVCRHFGGTYCLHRQVWSTSDVITLGTFVRYSNMPFCCTTYGKLATAVQSDRQHHFKEHAGLTCRPNTRVHKSRSAISQWPLNFAHWHLVLVCPQYKFTHWHLVLVCREYNFTHWHLVLVYPQYNFTHWHLVLVCPQYKFTHWHLVLVCPQYKFTHWHLVLVCPQYNFTHWHLVLVCPQYNFTHWNLVLVYPQYNFTHWHLVLVCPQYNFTHWHLVLVLSVQFYTLASSTCVVSTILHTGT